MTEHNLIALARIWKNNVILMLSSATIITSRAKKKMELLEAGPKNLHAKVCWSARMVDKITSIKVVE